MSPLRITFLSTSSLDYPSPRGRWLPLAHELARQGCLVNLLLLHHTYDRLSPSLRHQQHNGYTVSYVSQMHVYGPVGQRRYFRAGRLLAVSLAGACALARVALRQGCDVLHVCKPQPINGLAGLIAANILRCPLYVDCDDYEAGGNRFGAAWQQRVVQLWEDRLPRHAAGVTVNTRFLQQRYETLGVPPAHIVYVPNGITPERLRPPNLRHVAGLRGALGIGSEPVVLYVGTLSQTTHNVGLLLEAFGLALPAVPTARLVLVGEGEDRASLYQRAQGPDVRGRVLFAGAIDYQSVPVFFGLATCSVDPVGDDPVARARSPLKIVESLAAGVPVVTGDVGDRAEMLAHGAAGVLVEPGSAAALAQGLITALTAPEEQQSAWERRAREQAERHTWPHLAAHWKTIYNEPTG
jgi:glycosyltransferase involved in cell wall biosynthesis